MQRRRLGCSLFLTMVIAACGSGGSSNAPSGSATPAPRATPLPSAVPTPRANDGIDPMVLLDGSGFATAYATGVNGRGWISIQEVQGTGSTIVLPPDAATDGGEAPVPGCPVGAASPSCARTDVAALLVGESDWYSGRIRQPLGSTALSLPAAFGPDGEVVLLVPCCDGIDVSPGDVLPAPGGRFLGSLSVSDPANVDRRIGVPALWRAPGDVREPLPIEGLTFGASASAADASGRIAGEGHPQGGQNARPLPVVWLPDGRAYELGQLPLLSGDSSGSASAIDTGQVVGWSGGPSGRTPVVWETKDGAWSVVALPVPDGLRTCTPVATSGDRIAGNCEVPDLRERAIVWRRDGDGWRVETFLNPAFGIDSAYASAMSGDLVVGVSGNVGGAGTAAGPVAWRLPVGEKDAR